MLPMMRETTRPVRFRPPTACLIAVALLVGCSPRQPSPSGGFDPQPTRGYILISIDTLRADHLGAYGYARDTSPFFDSLAAKGTLFERLVVQYPSTLTSRLASSGTSMCGVVKRTPRSERISGMP